MIETDRLFLNAAVLACGILAGAMLGWVNGHVRGFAEGKRLFRTPVFIDRVLSHEEVCMAGSYWWRSAGGKWRVVEVILNGGDLTMERCGIVMDLEAWGGEFVGPLDEPTPG